MRTTLDIDDPVLRDLKRLQKTEGQSLGRLVSDLLAIGLAQFRARKGAPPAFQWNSQPMGARVDLADREAILTALDAAEVADPRKKGRRR